MPLDRLLITLAVILFGLSTFALARGIHLLFASRVSTGRGIPAVLYFRSDHCTPCQVQGRYLAEVEATFDGRIAMQKIDTDAERELAERYGIFTIPTTLVLDGAGKVRHINYGLTDARKLVSQLHAVELAS